MMNRDMDKILGKTFRTRVGVHLRIAVSDIIKEYRVQRGKADWPSRLMARTRVGVRLRIAVSDIKKEQL
jgi:hypothetical protein